MRKKHRWLDAEEKWLIEHYASHSIGQCAYHLGLSAKTVYSKAYALGLRKDLQLRERTLMNSVAKMIVRDSRTTARRVAKELSISLTQAYRALGILAERGFVVKSGVYYLNIMRGDGFGNLFNDRRTTR